MMSVDIHKETLIAFDEQRKKIEKEIASLEKMARTEKQPKKKYEIVQSLKMLKKEIEEML